MSALVLSRIDAKNRAVGAHAKFNYVLADDGFADLTFLLSSLSPTHQFVTTVFIEIVQSIGSVRQMTSSRLQTLIEAR